MMIVMRVLLKYPKIKHLSLRGFRGIIKIIYGGEFHETTQCW